MEIAVIIRNCNSKKELSQVTSCFSYYTKRKQLPELLEKKLKSFIRMKKMILKL